MCIYIYIYMYVYIYIYIYILFCVFMCHCDLSGLCVSFDILSKCLFCFMHFVYFTYASLVVVIVLVCCLVFLFSFVSSFLFHAVSLTGSSKALGLGGFIVAAIGSRPASLRFHCMRKQQRCIWWCVGPRVI